MVKYLIDGAGLWMTRLESVNGDMYIFITTVFSCFLMTFMHFLFAIINHYQLRLFKESALKKYSTSMRNVFLQCAVINLFNMIICWFWTPFWLIVILNILNGFSTFMLILHNNQRNLIRDYYAGITATESLNYLKSYIEEHRKEERVLLSQVSDIVSSVNNDIQNAK